MSARSGTAPSGTKALPHGLLSADHARPYVPLSTFSPPQRVCRPLAGAAVVVLLQQIKEPPLLRCQNEINLDKKQAGADEFLVTDCWKGDLDRVSLVGGIEPLGQLAQQSFSFLGVCTKKVLEVVPGHGVKIEIRKGDHRGRARQSKQ